MNDFSEQEEKIQREFVKFLKTWQENQGELVSESLGWFLFPTLLFNGFRFYGLYMEKVLEEGKFDKEEMDKWYFRTVSEVSEIVDDHDIVSFTENYKSSNFPALFNGINEDFLKDFESWMESNFDKKEVDVVFLGTLCIDSAFFMLANCDKGDRKFGSKIMEYFQSFIKQFQMMLFDSYF